MVSFTETLQRFLHRARVGSKTLSKLTGIPRPSIENWLQGFVQRPKHWRPLLQIARALSLSDSEVDVLLASAGYPRLADLIQDLPIDHPDRVYLQPWIDASRTSMPKEIEDRLQALEAQLVAEPSPVARYHQLRPPVADFVGREQEIAQVFTTLHHAVTAGRGAIISGFQGMGGIGKTELAHVVAHRLYDLFPDAQIVIDLQGSSTTPLTAEQALRQIIHALTPDEKLPDTLATLQAHYRSVLHRRRILILGDDARDASQVRPLIPPAGCVLLVTSRQRFSLPGMTTINMEPLSETEAITLLRDICDRLSVEDAQAIAQACGRLPLALRVSAGILRNNPALAVADYTRRLADISLRLSQLRDPDDAQLDVAATLALSYDLLEQGAQRVFRQLGAINGDFATALALAVIEADAGQEIEAMLHLLLRRNLVLYDVQRARWRLHDLVQSLALRYLEASGEREATAARYAHAALQIAHEIQDQYLAGNENTLVALARFDAERSHIDAAWQWATTHAGTPDADSLLVAMVHTTYHIGKLRYDVQSELLPIFSRALAAAHRLGDRESERMVLNCLGTSYWALGNSANAIYYFEQALIASREIGDRHGEGQALNNLAVVYGDRGESNRAIELYEQSLAIDRELGDRRGEAQTLNNLGISYQELGERLQAIPYHEQALMIAEAIGDLVVARMVRNNLGIAHIRLGNPQKAIPYYEQDLSIADKLGDRRGESIALINLGDAYIALGDAQKALDASTRALALARQLNSRRQEGYALGVLGMARLALGDIANAITSFEQTIAIFHTIGERHGEAEYHWKLGMLFVREGERERALPLLRAAVAHEQEIGHANAEEHAALLAQIEAYTT